MRLMEMIRRRGKLALMIFLGFFVISVFAGLGVGYFNSNKMDPSRSQEIAAGKRPIVDPRAPDNAAVMFVNGRPVSDKEFNELFAAGMDRLQEGSDDPWNVVYVYGSLIEQLTTEQVLLGQAKELGVKVNAEDIDKAKADAMSRYVRDEDQQSGNLVGDLGKKLGEVREKKRAFGEFLERMGMSEQQWLERVQRELLMDNTRKKFQELADEKKKSAAEGIKQQVDAALAKGEKFAEVAKKFSDDASAAEGGDIGSWVGRDLLFDAAIADKVFATPKGQVTEWFDIPAGFQRFEVYDKKEAAGPDYEKDKPALIKKLKDAKPDEKDYTPTEDEIKKSYEAVKFRQIMLKTTDDGAGEKKLEELVKDAKIEINDPFMLAFQALTGDKLQPTATMDYDALVAIAQTAAVGKDYDFALIKRKLNKKNTPNADATPSVAEAAVAAAKEDDAPAADATDAEMPAVEDDSGAADAPAADAATDGDQPAGEPRQIDMTPDTGEPVPLYALAIGLFTKALQDLGGDANYLQYYFIAKTYSDWLQDDKNLAKQPVDRDKARQKIDECMQQVLKSQEYNAAVHALQGLNLAWLGKKEDARKSLELAEKYAQKKPSGMWQTLKKGFEVLGDTAKADEIQKLSDKLMQDYFQEQFSRQMQQQQGGGQSTPIQIPAG